MEHYDARGTRMAKNEEEKKKSNDIGGSEGGENHGTYIEINDFCV